MKFVFKNEKLSKYSWFNLGGPAKLFYKINSTDDLKKILSLNNNLNFHILGAGSNTLFRDGGFDGAIIKLGKEFSFIKLINEDKIEVGASTMDKKISDFACENSISGFEFLSCIPGCIGGSIMMNSGCYGEEISNIFLSMKAMNLNGKIINLNKYDINFFYRGNNIEEKLIILSAILKGKKSNKNHVLEKTARFIKKKKESQPTQVKTCGSTFKNPENKNAWELIKFSQCSNLSVGDAYISEKHNNFFINKGKATASEIEELINKVKEKVYKKTGTKLELEIKIIGKPLI